MRYEGVSCTRRYTGQAFGVPEANLYGHGGTAAGFGWPDAGMSVYTARTCLGHRPLANDIAGFNAFGVTLSRPTPLASNDPFAFPRPSRAFSS